MALIVVVTNTSDLADVSDYRYEVVVGDGSTERSNLIVHGTISGHTRADGWKALVQRVINES